MQKKDDEQIIRKFSAVKGRQLAAVSRRPGLFGALSKKDVLIGMVVVILAFINFSSWNWRCPSCRNYLGNDIIQQNCKKCGARLRK